jgi:hypothetical protein
MLMASPAAGVEFDRNRLSQGELIAGISGLVLLIDLWFKWYGVKVSAGGGLLKGFSVGVSASAWEAFSLIDIILFLVALIAIGVAVMRGLNRMPDMPYPPATLVAVAGGIAVLLILFRILDTPVDTHGVNGIDVTRKIGVWLGLLAAAGVTYGGWRAMQESGATFGDLGGGLGTPAGTGASASAPTTQMPAGGAGDAPGVPGGGAAGVSPGKEGPGAPHPGTSTGGPGDAGGGPPPAAASSDPVPGQTGAQTPPGIAGEPPSGTGTTPPGI